MTTPTWTATIRRDAPGILAITATYVYFLLYAQFVFLELLRLRLPAAQIETAMASMGLAGLAASLATGVALSRSGPRRSMAGGFVLAGATSLAALDATSSWGLHAAAAAIGASTAIVTVALAASLRSFLGSRRFGLKVGLGTGLAYFFCNLPSIFEGSPELGSLVAAGACGIGMVAALSMRRPASQDLDTGAALRRRDFLGWGFASIVLAFLALIWLDSAAFAVIQETLALKSTTWGGGGQKLVLGTTHLAAALLAGWLIDRGTLRALLLATFGLFTVAFLMLERGAGTLAAAGPLYVTGISLYSVALVAYPSYRGDEPGLIPGRWRAAILFGVAGWIGSALGVGMALDLHRIPRPFLLVVGTVLAVSTLANDPRGRRWLRSHTGTLVVGAAGVAFYTLGPPTAGGPAAPADATYAAARGRRVYIQEGCIHCHSQYIRPRSHDVELWGPVPAHDAAETPPLYGNRRQGPDLSNAGIRRSATWHRLHLADPRSLVPTSRMPSYPHLFEDGTRGDDLVAYLSSLGAENGSSWLELTRSVEMASHPGSPGRGQRLFATYCAPCHGAEGRGDGTLAPAVYRPAMNLRKGAYWLIDWGPGAEPTATALARLVKYGVPGTSMPGHEYFSNRDVADVVAFVETLGGDGPRMAAR